MTSLQPIGLFLVYFGVAIAFEAVFIALYMAVTPHHEATLIKQGNAAAAISLYLCSIWRYGASSRFSSNSRFICW